MFRAILDYFKGENKDKSSVKPSNSIQIQFTQSNLTYLVNARLILIFAIEMIEAGL